MQNQTPNPARALLDERIAAIETARRTAEWAVMHLVVLGCRDIDRKVESDAQQLVTVLTKDYAAMRDAYETARPWLIDCAPIEIALPVNRDGTTAAKNAWDAVDQLLFQIQAIVLVDGVDLVHDDPKAAARGIDKLAATWAASGGVPEWIEKMPLDNLQGLATYINVQAAEATKQAIRDFHSQQLASGAAGHAPVNNESLTDNEYTVLRALRGARPRRVLLADLVELTSIPRKACGEVVNSLIERHLAARPGRERKGATITVDGEALLATEKDALTTC